MTAAAVHLLHATAGYDRNVGRQPLYRWPRVNNYNLESKFANNRHIGVYVQIETRGADTLRSARTSYFTLLYYQLTTIPTRGESIG